MICPVCDHVQESGARCEVCGRDLASEGAIEDPVEVLEGLEPTHLPAVPLQPGAEGVPGLEPTGFGRLVVNEEARPEVLACPYCRAAAASADVFCAGCGMKLPIYRRAARRGASGEPPRCRVCGGLLLHGPTCANCGTRVPSEDE